MSRGRPPLPVELHKFKGSYREDRHGGAKVYSTAELPLLGDPPDHLSDARKAIWQELRLAACPGVLRVSDRFFLEVLCGLLDQFRTDPDIKAAHLGLLVKTLAKLGFAPEDRQRLGVAPPAKPSSTDTYMHLED